jgi:hydroxymethylbilane synthase
VTTSGRHGGDGSPSAPTRGRRLVIGSRGSALALAQTRFMQAELRRLAPEVATEVRIIKTSADKDQATSLRTPAETAGSSGAGVFVKELEQALLGGEIDLAVHSMKDVPTVLAPGLCIAAVPERESAFDALVINKPALDALVIDKPAPGARTPLAILPPGARVGTGSFRRQAQLLALRPDIEILDIRGNVDTRIRKMEAGQYDAVALACAGLRRLGLQRLVSYAFQPAEMLPAPGQGALAVETRADDDFARSVASRLDHPPTAMAVAAERDFLERLGGGCNVPIAIYARVTRSGGGGVIEMDAVVASPDGRRVVRDALSGPPGRGAELVAALAARILDAGGREILDEFRR